jgi:mannose-6-phosphate isomerase-like protein (cupin superfamily)
MRPIRRVITGHNTAGKSVILFDDKVVPAGKPAADLWANYETPANITSRDDVAALGLPFHPPPGGALFRQIAIPPESAVAHFEGDTLRQMMRDSLNGAGGPGVVVDQTRHWAMHKTRSIDYIVLLTGKVTMIMDEGEVDLEPHDVVVQRGTNHAWANRSSEPATLLLVMVDADPV